MISLLKLSNIYYYLIVPTCTVKVKGFIHQHFILANNYQHYTDSTLARNPSSFHPTLQFDQSKCRMLVSTSLSSASEAISPPINPVKATTCKFCKEQFSSRNSLFRHIESCSQRPVENLPQKEKNQRKRSTKKKCLAFRFSYAFMNKHSSEQHPSEIEAQIAARNIQNNFQRTVCTKHKAYNAKPEFEILTTTHASVANQRHKSLAQEVGCAAANDIMTISFLSNSTWLTDNNLHELVNEMNDMLQQENSDLQTRVLGISFLNSLKFHAENSCTQYSYHYILPLKWLKDGELLQQWWLSYEDHNSKSIANTTETTKLHPGSFQSNPPSQSLKILRNALKSAESKAFPNRRVRRRSPKDDNSTPKRKIIKIGKRKMGTITNKEKRAFHNFADPSLQGDASPNQEPVWRILDRCRIFEIKRNPMNDEVVAVLEFRGDAFLPQQIRRIVGTAVGITNGWLPENTMDIATRQDVAIETALAPSGRLYLNDLRFHFDESNEDFLIDKEDSLLNTNWLQCQIFDVSSNQEISKMEDMWLRGFEVRIAPKIRNQIIQINDNHKIEEEDESFSVAPAIYAKVLQLLKKISVSNWPSTSVARSKVIKNAEEARDEESGQNKFGSFTIINPKLFMPTATQSLPLGNQLFPELVQAVFELEVELSKQTLRAANQGYIQSVTKKTRKSSTHCAINFNARFTPHVDSGTGLGQSLSMIVGLGDYNSGEIFVEGTSYPIRYNPLVFDGWKQRHWTNAYTGERFSLVWFTPETK